MITLTIIYLCIHVYTLLPLKKNKLKILSFIFYWHKTPLLNSAEYISSLNSVKYICL